MEEKLLEQLKLIYSEKNIEQDDLDDLIFNCPLNFISKNINKLYELYKKLNNSTDIEIFNFGPDDDCGISCIIKTEDIQIYILWRDIKDTGTGDILISFADIKENTKKENIIINLLSETNSSQDFIFEIIEKSNIKNLCVNKPTFLPKSLESLGLYDWKEFGNYFGKSQLKKLNLKNLLYFNNKDKQIVQRLASKLDLTALKRKKTPLFNLDKEI